jgi:hypothetical protein
MSLWLEGSIAWALKPCLGIFPPQEDKCHLHNLEYIPHTHWALLSTHPQQGTAEAVTTLSLGHHLDTATHTEEPMRVATATQHSRVALLNMIELKTLIPVITFYNVCTGCQQKENCYPTRLNSMTNWGEPGMQWSTCTSALCYTYISCLMCNVTRVFPVLCVIAVTCHYGTNTGKDDYHN